MITNADAKVKVINELLDKKKKVMVLQDDLDREKFAIAYEDPEHIEPKILCQGRRIEILNILNKIGPRGDTLRKQLSRK
jgi:cobalamin biosynthesis protein CbiG